MYKITAPTTAYNRKVCGVQFADGVGHTEDEWAASWFSGREGFSIEAEQSALPVDSGAPEKAPESFPCPHCDKVFKSAAELKTHCKKEHPEAFDNTDPDATGK